MDNNIKKEIKCNQCQKIFLNERQLSIHNKQKHSEILFKRGRPKKSPQYFQNPEKDIEYAQFFFSDVSMEGVCFFRQKKEEQSYESYFSPIVTICLDLCALL